ncbi:unnamed protein product [Paramecium sonneborni]|uniref:Septin-type G domain-containing protein n=1 Tax=Paramecium sonneborni TaxID=65129 RepID=A0A8S1PXB7_9CILI|nr:unnamed protein product [Paramecium sonneborni]
MANKIFELESQQNHTLSQKEQNKIALFKYLQVYYSLNQKNACQVLLKIMNEFHIEDITQFENQKQKIIQKYQLVQDTCVGDLINILQNELEVKKSQVLNVAWNFQQKGIRSRYDLTFVTKEEANYFQINNEKLLEWKKKPENQSYSPFFKLDIKRTQPLSNFIINFPSSFQPENKNQFKTFQNSMIKMPLQIDKQMPKNIEGIQKSSITKFYTHYNQQNFQIQSFQKQNPSLQNSQNSSLMFQNQPNINNFQPPSFQKLNNLKNQEYKFQLQKNIKNNDEIQKIKKETIKQNLESLVQDCVKLKEIQGKDTTLKIIKYPKYQKEDLNNLKEMKTIMIIGETGVGKSTIINFLCNYYNGVEFEFPFRFFLVDETDESIFSKSEAVSKTSEVISYYLKGSYEKPNLRIIDTPGFGDTRGQQFDQIISQRITDFLNNLDSLSLICFVMRSSQNRLTLDQIYIMNSLIEIFGNDMGEHFMFLFTFSDFEDPQALQVLLFNGKGDYQASPFVNIIPRLKNPYWLKFNNLAFLSTETKELIKKQWQESYQQFQVLVEEKICKSEFLDLTMTKKVIEERKQIQDIFDKLKQEIQKYIDITNQIQADVDKNDLLKAELQTSKTFLEVLIKDLLFSVNTLNKFALKTLDKDFQKECLDILIKNEEDQKKDGYQMRVQCLLDIKELWNSIKIQIN